MEERTARKFLDIMQELVSLHRDLLMIAEKKQEALMNGNLKELDEAVQNEQRVVIQIGRAEERRMEALREIFGERENMDEVNAPKVLSALAPDEMGEFEKIRDELMNALKEIGEINETNSELLRISLSYVDFAINLIAGDSGDCLYGPGAKNEISRRLIDWKA